jgi:hypothetical protein
MSNQDSTVGNTTARKPEMADTATTAAPRKRGFAAMDRNTVRDLARKGGVAAHRAGTAHEFSSDEARVAGRKGGLATHGARREGTTDDTNKSS